MVVCVCWAAMSTLASPVPAEKSAKTKPAKVKASRSVPGADIFVPAPLRTIKIEITGAAWEQLQRDDRHYARATFHDGTNVLRDVGIHVKGAAGSRRGLGDNPALTVNFDKFTPDQQWHGLQKIHLNNSVQDPSYLTENICGEMFRQAGVPAPRACNVRMNLNGRDLGVYVLKEGFDKTFVKQYYAKAKGNLYDGGFCRDVTEGLEKLFGNDSKQQPELRELVAAANEPDAAKRWQRLGQVLDVDRFVSFCALEVMCWDWDGYVMKPNNYKLYWDPETKKITFFPHGLDQMFWEPRGPLMPNISGMVARAVMQSPEGGRLYRARMTELLTNVFRVEVITNRVNEYAVHIRNSIAEHNKNAARDYDGQVRRIRDLITSRAAFLEKQLLGPEPSPVSFVNGVAALRAWETEYEVSVARREPRLGPDGKDTLTLIGGARTTASWRSKLRLPAGRYRFEATARAAGVVAIKDELGEGAGLRISGARQTRTNKLAGDAPWQPLRYEFDVGEPSEEVVLVCELRASKGQVWFDANSLRLVKVK